MNLSFEMWTNCLIQSQPQVEGEAHKIICRVREGNEQPTIQVLTKEEFASKSQQNGWFTTVCSKLSLGEIVQISAKQTESAILSNQIYGNTRTGISQIRSPHPVQDILQPTSLERANYEVLVATSIQVVEQKCNLAASVIDALKKMQESKNKKETKWTWYSDNQKAIETISKSVWDFNDIIKSTLWKVNNQASQWIHGIETLVPEDSRTLPDVDVQDMLYQEKLEEEINTPEKLQIWLDRFNTSVKPRINSAYDAMIQSNVTKLANIAKAWKIALDKQS